MNKFTSLSYKVQCLLQQVNYCFCLSCFFRFLCLMVALFLDLCLWTLIIASSFFPSGSLWCCFFFFFFFFFFFVVLFIRKREKEKLKCYVNDCLLASKYCKHYFGKQICDCLFILVMARLFLGGVSKIRYFAIYKIAWTTVTYHIWINWNAIVA